MPEEELQTSFFRYIKERLPAHLSMVDEIAELLNISNDSAYRRIRGEKPLTFNEMKLLANRYQVSLDQFLHVRSKSLLFSASYIDRDQFDFETYLQTIVSQLSIIASANQSEMFYLNKDIPLFHHFMFPELAAFKCYFWSRYNLNYAQFNKGQFLIDDFIDIFNTTGQKIVDLYLQIPSTEIWNLDCINTTIRQIDYYRESKIFKSNTDILTVYKNLEKLVDHIEKQVEYGYKFRYGNPGTTRKVPYRVFINEFILGDNTVIVEIDGVKAVFLNHSVINFIMTTDQEFTTYITETLKVLLKKSTLISEIGEKDRQLFFDTLRYRIDEKKQLVK